MLGALRSTRGPCASPARAKTLPIRVRATSLRSRTAVAVVAQAVRFPAALPLLPFTPKEILPPGSTKVLRLYDSSSYMLLLEELLSSPHGMLVHSAILPAGSSHGAGGDMASRLGGYQAGGYVFFLSTIIKVIDIKQTEAGVLLRVQSEGRVAVKSLAQTRPYFRAVVVPVTDTVDLDRLQSPAWRDISTSVDRLRQLMREVQDLANKFKTPEANNLQRAMSWVDNPQPLVFSSSSMLLNSRTRDPGQSGPNTGTTPSLYGSTGSLGSGDDEDFQPSKILASNILPDSITLTDSSPTNSTDSDRDRLDYATAAALNYLGPNPGPGARGPSSSGADASSPSSADAPGSGSPGLPGGAQAGLMAAAVMGADSSPILGGASIKTRPSLLDLERACRLSLAAIQLLPNATEEEREAIRRHQQAALETQDVVERLTLAYRVMAEARGLLAAKCALMSLSLA
ncbi:hypothetical protein HYH03_004018 [Edaphochlamys debaryana]|uniref:Lon N-terminal domain-containing protein n=1 Tax=Edaphochlamys debaryana TaxID=47281 RepID=A0A835YAS5_9CHLO|nr:hypothetical protein HYH03_004018 [Edaphochlamys debaryana]|eukprot:KAG2498269.1 hypothetical protein HYH03_004018 [Edaphochlamys debaryana]